MYVCIYIYTHIVCLYVLPSSVFHYLCFETCTWGNIKKTLLLYTFKLNKKIEKVLREQGSRLSELAVYPRRYLHPRSWGVTVGLRNFRFTQLSGNRWNLDLVAKRDRFAAEPKPRHRTVSSSLWRCAFSRSLSKDNADHHNYKITAQIGVSILVKVLPHAWNGNGGVGTACGVTAKRAAFFILIPQLGLSALSESSRRPHSFVAAQWCEYSEQPLRLRAPYGCFTGPHSQTPPCSARGGSHYNASRVFVAPGSM